MPNKTLFSSKTKNAPRATTTNRAQAVAYALSPKHALAQLAATGCFQNVFYSSAQNQLDTLTRLVDQVDDNEYLAKLAVYARQRACMKDMPAALLAMLSRRDTELMHRVFDRVVDNGRVLRTLFQMIRSGQFADAARGHGVGLSSSVQRAFQRWLNEASVSKLLAASIGNDPSLRDVLRMARPKPKDNARRALFGWLTDKDPAKWGPATAADLPELVQTLIAYRRAETEEAQTLIAGDLRVRWDLLADAAEGPLVWNAIARQMGPQALRMNLNTLLRHGVIGDSKQQRKMVKFVANRIADPQEVARSRQFPYQYLTAYRNASDQVPHAIRKSLQAAAELACGNVPALRGPVVIGLDTSGSMQSPVTGFRRGATSKMRCVDVAALFAAAILRRNPDSVIVPFDTQAYKVRIDPSDSILSIAERLAAIGGGGTDCSIPLQEANTKHKHRRFAGAILVSDNQSWVYNSRPFAYGNGGATGMMEQWTQFKSRQQCVADPKLVCIDIQPYQTTQAPERNDIVNIGGFSDSVFHVVAAFLDDNPSRFVDEVESITL